MSRFGDCWSSCGQPWLSRARKQQKESSRKIVRRPINRGVESPVGSNGCFLELTRVSFAANKECGGYYGFLTIADIPL